MPPGGNVPGSGQPEVSITPALLLTAAGVGAALGAIAARIRAPGTPLEGRLWVIALGAVAGAVLGAVVSLTVALGAALLDYVAGGARRWELFGPTLLVLLALFLVFALRRSHAR